MMKGLQLYFDLAHKHGLVDLSKTLELMRA
jgi:hypothetical protein